MKNHSKTLKPAWLRCLIWMGAMALAACDSNFTPPDNMAGSSLSAYNFSAEGIQEYFVDGAWGGGVGIGSGGGQVCCVSIPRKWHDKLQVTVEWRRSDCGRGVDSDGNSKCVGEPRRPQKSLKKTVPIEPYSDPDTVQVFFLPHDEIRVYVSDMAPWHSDHPSKLGDVGPHPFTEEEFQRLMKK
ncbi:DUF3304 domain-containing protein [Dechloromonas sp. CZR5]|uniref:DUF3304 domain-containing protein n=1 Tax=Dechloromonas sp. CZR5 TaxID=2608630 RepID=UPI00123D02F6|nr:DUF3304 domain-containing protein [Dechloromonas sp. CZR5]